MTRTRDAAANGAPVERAAVSTTASQTGAGCSPAGAAFFPVIGWFILFFFVALALYGALGLAAWSQFNVDHTEHAPGHASGT